MNMEVKGFFNGDRIVANYRNMGNIGDGRECCYATAVGTGLEMAKDI